MKDDRMKYDLTWIVENLDSEWIYSETETFIKLVQWMKSELDRRKDLIEKQTSIIGKQKELLKLKDEYIDNLKSLFLETVIQNI